MATSEELAQIDISKVEKYKLVAKVMRYMLLKTHQISGCPVKREDLTGIVTNNYCQRVLPTFVINEARDRLAATFRYEMRELQWSRAPSTPSGRPSQLQSNVEAKSYVLVSQLDQCIASTLRIRRLICNIRLAGGKISKEDLCHQLKRLGLKNDSDEKHSALCNNKQALELLQQR